MEQKKLQFEVEIPACISDKLAKELGTFINNDISRSIKKFVGEHYEEINNDIAKNDPVAEKIFALLDKLTDIQDKKSKKAKSHKKKNH